VKILDMGLSRSLFEVGAQDQEGIDAGLTAEGVVLGTPDYMAPEQARDARLADIRADIYSLGCVLYHLLAGQPPFPDTNFISQMIRHATEPATPLKKFNPGVPDGLQQIVNWMMAKDPGQRYPTPERAGQALGVFLAAGNDALAVPEADPKMRTYLTWLQRENEHQPQSDPSPLAGASAVPKVVPAVAATVAPPLASTQGMPAQAAPARPPAPPLPPAPSAKSSARLPRPAPANQGDTGKSAKQRTRKLRKQLTGEALPTAAPPEVTAVPEAEAEAVELASVQPAEDDADVELISSTGLTGGPGRHPFDTHLDRRDFVMFGLGVGAGGLAAGIGCWLALRRKAEDTDKQDK
jgi:eukaryotic-like serine/threonine-protein kinase